MKYGNIAVGIDNEVMFGQYYKVTSVPFITIYGKDKRLIGVYHGKVDIDVLTRTIDG
jgi:hypothetical protein